MFYLKVICLAFAASAVVSNVAIGESPIRIDITQEAMQSRSKSGRLIFDFLPKEHQGRGLGIINFQSMPFGAFEKIICGAKVPDIPGTSLTIVHSPNAMDMEAFERCFKKLTVKTFDTETGAIHVISSAVGDSDQQKAVLEILIDAVGN